MHGDGRRSLTLFPADVAREPTFPSTRYQGSKAKITAWLMDCLRDLEFADVLDAFGGTGAVSYALKKAGKYVTYNDHLRFNEQVGIALIENHCVRLNEPAIARVLGCAADADSTGFVASTFRDIYFTEDENAWIDGAVEGIQQLTDRHERALAYWSLFQSCIAKRPFNLFHRKNLYIRTAEVRRSFGNKSTWDKPFAQHFRAFAEEANLGVFDNGQRNRVTCLGADDLGGDFDLVYLDPPYTSAKGVSVDYQQFYHFLEGLVRYEEWPSLVDRRRKHRPMRKVANPWVGAATIRSAFLSLFRKFKQSILAVSYRDDGQPTVPGIVQLLAEAGRTDISTHTIPYQYVLSKTNGHEVLVVSRP